MADEQTSNHEEPVIRDKRRIDPETGEVRQPAADADGAPAEGAPRRRGRRRRGRMPRHPTLADDEDVLTVDDILNAANAEVQEPSDEHLADLKRVTAEYANYRKRTEANREVERERAVGAAVAVLLPVLDDLDRAEKHGDLEGDAPFATIAAKLRAAVEKLGLTPFGEVGEPFDPQRHEAIFQQPSRRGRGRHRRRRRRDRLHARRHAAPRGEGRREDAAVTHVRPARGIRHRGCRGPAVTDFRQTSDRGGADGQPGLVRQGLLPGARRLQGRERRRAQEDVPQARAQVPPRLEPRRRRRRGEVQGDQRGALGALRPRAAQGVRRDPRHGLRRAVHRARRRRRRRRLRGRLRRHVRRQGGGRQSYTFQQGGDYDDLLGGLFGGGRFGQPSGGYRGFGGPSRGRDVTASTTLDFITATKGEQITLQTADGKPITVRIPAGVADGQKIQLRGKGHPSPDGGESGDLILTVTVRKHPVFERDGLNLRVNVPVTFAEAALGATIQVPTLGGDPVKLRVAPGTPSGRVLRVKGRGVETSKGTGDLLAVVQVAVPVAPVEGGRGEARGVRRRCCPTRTRATSCSRRRRAQR